MPSRLLVPLVFHPTHTVVLDDDLQYMSEICYGMDDLHPYVNSDDPQEILRYLRKHTYTQDAFSKLFVRQFFEVEKPTSNATEVIAIDFSQSKHLLTPPNRFRIATTGLMDRRMKKIDGFEVCATVRAEKLPVKMIMLTGQTTDKEAVDAFKRHVIDGYLVKEGAPEEITNAVNETISKEARQQFLELSETLAGLLAQQLWPLYDEQFALVNEGFDQQHAIVESYILDSSCSFLKLDRKGKAIELFVRNEDDFKTCYDIANDSKAPYDVLQALRSRQAFPYTKDPMGYLKLKGDAWEEVMVQMDKVPGRELYTAEVERPDIEALSFDEYMNTIWPK